jgi:hypothetical protein
MPAASALARMPAKTGEMQITSHWHTNLSELHSVTGTSTYTSGSLVRSETSLTGIIEFLRLVPSVPARTSATASEVRAGSHWR